MSFAPLWVLHWVKDDSPAGFVIRSIKPHTLDQHLSDDEWIMGGRDELDVITQFNKYVREREIT